MASTRGWPGIRSRGLSSEPRAELGTWRTTSRRGPGAGKDADRRPPGDRLHTRGTGALPTNRESAAWEVAEGQRAALASRPRNRRWRPLDKFDRELEQLAQRQVKAQERLSEEEEAVRTAPEHDARTLATWLQDGEKGERPAASIYERERDRDAAKLLLDAVTVERDALLERRREHVESNRRKMLADARRDVDAARSRLLSHIGQLPELRQALLDARATVEWAASYPEPTVSYGFATAAALGLREPIERTLRTTARIEYVSVVEALEADAAALADAYGPDLGRKLGLAAPATPLDTAMWDSEVPDAWRREQLAKAQGLLPWSSDPRQLVQEADDFRPDPPTKEDG
jgi:hypothetical protein